MGFQSKTKKTWVDLGTSGALLSLHPASSTAEHVGSSIENGISIGFLVGDLKSALEELKAKMLQFIVTLLKKM